MACTPSSSAAGEGLASVGSRPDDQGSLRSAIIVPAASAVGGQLDLDGGWTTVQNKEAARRRRAAFNSLQVSSKFEMDVPETKLQNQISMPSKFEFHYLKKITNQFSKDLILGSGGFGIVYKGEKENGIVIAVKKLSDMQGTDDKQFLNEIKLLMDISHPNIVRVEGYCYHSEGELTPFNESYVVGEKVHRLLCFEYLPRGSLDKYLSDEFSGLEWQVRYNIIHGICKGLYCLHEDRPGATILHLDLKPENVLLDKHMIPKIADFGHSRLFGKGKTHSITVNKVGTGGYMAPEYIDRGMLAKEADIFSLGVILMEILTGYRKYPYNTTSQQLNEIKDKWRIRLQATLNKPSLEEQCGQINLCIIIAFKCMERDPEKRLNIKQIIEILGPRSVQEDGSDVEEQKWEVVPLEWRESLDIVALRSPEQSIKGMDVILRELLRIFETESTVPQYIIKDADRLVSYLSAMAEKTSRLILKGATSMSLDYFAGRFTINTLTQAFNIRDLAKAVKDDTLEKLLRDLLIWSTVNKDSELSKSIKMLLHKIQENAERTAMLLVLMNLLRPLDPGRWPSCATPVPLRERTHIYSQLVSGCLDTVAKNFLETIEEFDLDRILSSIQIYLEEIGVEEINKREKTKDTGLVAVMDLLAELVHIRGPVIKDHHSMARVDVGRQPIILAYIDKFLKPGYKTARARLKEMSDKRKTQEKMTSLKQLPEIQYDYLKKITNNFAEDRKISESALGSLYKGIVPDDGKVIAVKKLLEMSTDSTFEKLFHNIMVLKHENIVQIVGYGSKTSKKFVRSDKGYTQIDFFEGFICYEYLPNGSLKENLFGTKATRFVSSEQDWDARFKIINGICCGLRFLHKLDIPIIHMDLKPENILLDANMVPKIAGFELSRVLGQEHTRVWTQTVQGSYGYMAPEYLYRGEISAQTDIYSLGLMILEITTGEKNSLEEKQPSARKYIENVQNTWTQEHIEFKKSSLGQVGLQQVKMCIKIGLDCVCIDRKLRPSIETIVDRLYNVATRVLLKQVFPASVHVLDILEKNQDSTNAKPFTYNLKFLKDITNDFSKESELGRDEYGVVYKAILPSRELIVIRDLSPMHLLDDRTFQEAVSCLTRIKNQNVVQFIGYCAESDWSNVPKRLLCSEYVGNGSLAKYLYGAKAAENLSSGGLSINWDTHFKIIKGICMGLHYLHNLDIPIVYMDLRPENVLLDLNMVPKIKDFGVFKIFGQNETLLCTQTAAGSNVYMAPELLSRGEISVQSDIYSLGIMIIELTTREKNCPENDQPSARNFIDKVRKDWTLEHIASKYAWLNSEGLQQVKACIEIGLKCVEVDRRCRPPLNEIVDTLNGQHAGRKANEVRWRRGRTVAICFCCLVVLVVLLVVFALAGRGGEGSNGGRWFGAGDGGPGCCRGGWKKGGGGMLALWSYSLNEIRFRCFAADGFCGRLQQVVALLPGGRRYGVSGDA